MASPSWCSLSRMVLLIINDNVLNTVPESEEPPAEGVSIPHDPLTLPYCWVSAAAGALESTVMVDFPDPG